jgi:hypothetical protein
MGLNLKEYKQHFRENVEEEGPRSSEESAGIMKCFFLKLSFVIIVEVEPFHFSYCNQLHT